MEISDQVNWGETLDSIFRTPEDIRSHNLFRGLVEHFVERTAQSGIISTFSRAKVLDRDSKGIDTERPLDEWCSKVGGTDHDALKLIATDVSQKAFFAINNLYKNNHYKRVEKIKEDPEAYLLEHYLEPLKKGKRTILEIFYWRNTSLRKNTSPKNAGIENYNEGYALKMAAAAGETPEELLSLAWTRRILSQVTLALQETLSGLFTNFRDSFDYLVALIESALLVRESQADKPRSKKTSTVLADMSAIFLNALCELNEYSHERYRLVFSGVYDPFAQVSCGGATLTARVARVKKRARLLQVFRPLLRKSLKKWFQKKDVGNITRTIYKWVENVKYKSVTR